MSKFINIHVCGIDNTYAAKWITELYTHLENYDGCYRNVRAYVRPNRVSFHLKRITNYEFFKCGVRIANVEFTLHDFNYHLEGMLPECIYLWVNEDHLTISVPNHTGNVTHNLKQNFFILVNGHLTDVKSFMTKVSQ
jgi:hypothetical protein